MFQECWNVNDKEEVESYLAFWCDFALEFKIEPFIKLVNTIKTNWTGIVNYVKSRISNGRLEKYKIQKSN